MMENDDGKATDDAMVVETYGNVPVKLFEGGYDNIKVTTPEDLYTFRAMIQYRESEQIFGFANREVPSGLKK